MGWIIDSFFVNGDKKCFTGSMSEQSSAAGAIQEAKSEAKRIGEKLGLPVGRQEDDEFVTFVLGPHIEIRAWKNKR